MGYVSTKDQQREALEQIKAIVESLGEDSYLAAAFEGCFEIAKRNIESGQTCSMKQIADKAEESANYFKDSATRLSGELEAAQKENDRLKKRVLCDDDLTDLSQLISDRRFALDEATRMAVESIVKYAEEPGSTEFQQAVKDHRKAKSSLEYYTRLSDRVCRAMDCNSTYYRNKDKAVQK